MTSRVILEYTSQNGPAARHVRGVLIASSLRTLREAGLYERYLTHLAPAYREAVLLGIASSWLPLEVAAAHYEACDAMQLEDAQHIAIGEIVCKQIMGSFLATLMRTGRSFGATPTPWLALGQYHRVYERIVDGGTFMVTEVGPKDAVVETRGLPLFRFRYFRNGMLGIYRGGLSMFAKACFARELPGPRRDEQMKVSIRWV